MSPATTAIQTRLITPSANSDAISAQQQPTHQAPCRTPIRSAPEAPVAPGAEQEAERAAALAEADVLQRRQLVDRGDDQRRARDPAARAVPGEDVARDAPAATATPNASAPTAAQVRR